MDQITLALYFGNRGFFPGEVIKKAREDMIKAVTDCGYHYICMDENETKFGAVETMGRGRNIPNF